MLFKNHCNNANICDTRKVSKIHISVSASKVLTLDNENQEAFYVNNPYGILDLASGSVRPRIFTSQAC